MRFTLVGIALLVVISVTSVFAYITGYWSGSRASQTSSGVAVVDLDAVARQLGVDVTMEKQIKDAQTSLDQQLQSLQASLRQQYQQKSEELKAQQGKNGVPSDPAAVKQQLAEIEQKLNLQLLQAQQAARNKFNAYRNGLFQDFRGKVVPVAREVATQHCLGVVLTKNDSILLTFDAAHDITDAVVVKLRNNQPLASAQQISTAACPDHSASNRR